MGKPIIAARKVEPIGTRTAYGHINRGDKPHEWGEIQLPAYPDSENGRKLRARRIEIGLGLRDAAKLLGLSPVEASGLERGAYDTDDWPAVFDALADRAHAGAGEAGEET